MVRGRAVRDPAQARRIIGAIPKPLYGLPLGRVQPNPPAANSAPSVSK